MDREIAIALIDILVAAHFAYADDTGAEVLSQTGEGVATPSASVLMWLTSLGWNATMKRGGASRTCFQAFWLTCTAVLVTHSNVSPEGLSTNMG